MSGTDAAGGLTSRGSAGDAPAEAATGHRASDAGGRFRFPTAILLTCAALGVAGAVLLAPMNWLSTLLTGPLPLVGLLVALIAGLVMGPFSGHGFSTVLTNLWWAAFTELPFLFVLWRSWGTWLHYVGAVAVGVVYPISAWAWFDLGSMSLFAQIAFFAVTIASCVGGTALGILIADRLRTAGVGGSGLRRS